MRVETLPPPAEERRGGSPIQQEQGGVDHVDVRAVAAEAAETVDMPDLQISAAQQANYDRSQDRRRGSNSAGFTGGLRISGALRCCQSSVPSRGISIASSGCGQMLTY